MALRVRPLKANETDMLVMQDENHISLGNDTWHVDRVYSSQSTQEDIFKSSLLPVMDAFQRG